MSKKSTPKAVPYNIANEQALQTVNTLLHSLDQPMNSNANTQKELKDKLYLALKEICEITQACLMQNAAGKANGVKADIVGWTTAETDYSKPEMLSKFKQAELVNLYLKDILKKQEERDLEAGSPISIQEVIKAQQQALDEAEETITLETLVDPETGIQSKIEIDKETGDTQLYRKDERTGMWYKVNTKLKGFWQDTKNFCKNIWNWLSKQWNRFVSWIKSVFKTPADAEVIIAQAA